MAQETSRAFLDHFARHPSISVSSDDLDCLYAARIQDVLDKQVAILTGSDGSDCAVMVIPNIGMKHLEVKGEFDELFETTIKYLTEQLPQKLKRHGITIVINARNIQSSVTKHVLEQLATSFPASIKTVYLMKTAGLFGLKKTVTSDVISKRLNLVYVYEPSGMVRYLPPRDLPTECGGELKYDHKQWILHKLTEERMEYYFSETSSKVKELLLPMREKLSVSCYGDVEAVLRQHLELKETIMTDLNETRDVIQRFIGYLQNKEYVDHTVMATQQHVSIVTQMENYIESLSEEEKLFSSFWDHHKAVLDHKIYLGDFLRSVEKVKGMLERYLAELAPTTKPGGDFEQAVRLGQDHEKFVSEVKETVDGHLYRLQDEGKHLREPLTLSNSSEVIENPYMDDTIGHIEHGLTELGKQYEAIMKQCQQKRELCINCVRYYRAVAECEKWCSEVSGYFSKEVVDETSTESISTAISLVDELVDGEPHGDVSCLKQIAGSISDKTIKKGANKHVNKCHKNHEKLQEKRQYLLKALAASFQPPPEPLPDPPPVTGLSVAPPLPTSPHSTSPTMLTDQYRPSLSSPDSLDTMSSRSDEQQDSPLLAMTSADYKSRKFVYDELVATERDYIHDLRSVMHGYYDDMSPDNNRVPVKLRGKRPIVFGNLHKIQKFHRDVFIAELQKHHAHPETVGEAFLQHVDEFALYEDYCKNKPDSDELLHTITPTEAIYFEQIQQSLGHQLPLASYLLKPVQRITKYQLLLKDLIRHTTEPDLEDTRETLMLALEKMLNILKYLNNSMKVVGLKGFPGSLLDQGRLLIQDLFQVTEVVTKGVSRRNIFPKGTKRHVFLFEKVIVFSKYNESNNGQDGRGYTQDSYTYKSHIPLDDLGLRDNIGDQPNELDLKWYSQQKMFKLIAASKESKDVWSGEIRRLLEEQLKQAKNKAEISRRPMQVAQTSQPAGDSSSGLSIERIGGTFRASIRRKDKKSPTTESKTTTPSGLTHITVGKQDRKTSLDQSVQPVNGSSVPVITRSDSAGSFDEDNELDSDVIYETLAPGVNKDYVAISDYTPGSAQNDIGLVEGQQVEVLGINQYGWWWVRAREPEQHLVVEGWVPAGYLQPLSIVTTS